MTNWGSKRSSATATPILELIVIAGIELERARSNLPFNELPIRQLGDALARVSSPSFGGAPVALVEPGYLRPFRGAYLLAQGGERPTASQVKEFMESMADRFRKFADNPCNESEADKLVDICIDIHRALRDEMRRQETSIGYDWGALDAATKVSRVTS